MSKFKRPGGAQPAKTAPAAPARPASKYARAKDVQIGHESNYIRASGNLLLMIERIEEGTTRNREDFVSTHLTVLAVDPSPRGDLEARFGGAIHRVGESVSYFQKVSGDYFDQNMLKLAIVASDLTQEQIAQKEEEENTTIVEEMVSPEQPFAGVVLEVAASIGIKKDGRSKKAEQLSQDDIFTKTQFVRRVPFAELKELVEADVLAQFLPDIDEKIAEEESNS